jgi:hypothetical protein
VSPENIVAVLKPAVLLVLKYVVLVLVPVRTSDRVHVVQTLNVQEGINVAIMNVVLRIRVRRVAKTRTAVSRVRNVVLMVRVVVIVLMVRVVNVVKT